MEMTALGASSALQRHRPPSTAPVQCSLWTAAISDLTLASSALTALPGMSP